MRTSFSVLTAALVVLLAWACQETNNSPADLDGTPLTLAANCNKNPDHPQCSGGGDPGGGGPHCDLSFDLTIQQGFAIAGDLVGDDYSNGVDRVQISGDGEGWRFDTNGSQKLDARNDKRKASVTLAGYADGNTPRGIDMRRGTDGPGLNFCELDTVGESVQVPVIVMFANDTDGSTTTVRYGGQTLDGSNCPADEATVTRTATGWTMVSGADACVVEPGGVLGAIVPMPFSFTLTQQ